MSTPGWTPAPPCDALVHVPRLSPAEVDAEAVARAP
ncbi:hypothetical protein HNR12_000642 [Streptomonospora nanhaiensis]|uniref:Uncharacterized protein n=1 Tax=Streptomonospora nanhaiensis TaxID=1323731 RepID=A0A853BI02_9ACTN|nr:hypothetical protein [Streptomonospora nanhaiensis]